MMQGASQNKIVPVPDNNPEHFVVIIGAMKSGTTSLFDILGQHPQICAAKEKEPNFFVTDSDSKKVDGYLGLWAWDKVKYKYALESSVAYTKFPFVNDVRERIMRTKLGENKFYLFDARPICTH
ncbi:MAG: sulfotransferase [Gammaproteobacteria bacterium]|nr:sulfotransferase [Gammaproteobacteria bacterium]